MYNPWSAHNHGHHTHAHAHTHPHHGHTQHQHHTPTPTVTPGSVPGSAPSNRLDMDSSPSHHTQSPSQSSYQMSQMRWLPSMITRGTHNPNATVGSLPNISSGLRMHHSQQTQSQGQQGQGQGQGSGVPGALEGRAAGSGPGLVNPASVAVGQAQGHAQAQAQAQVAVSVESEESDRSDSPGTRDVSGVDVLGDAEFGADDAARNGLERGDGDIMDVDGLAGASKGGAGGNGELGQASSTPRKHGKRLTTKEEVSLFEICNRHAGDFGQRSNLCKWWMTVTMEFTRGQKHPYSWHSVRRKVELVTKQRMRFLEEQREKGATEADDLSNPRWRAVVDAWIPTWQRWEEAEARRIEKRDSRRPRKRKWTITTPSSTTITTDQAWDIPTADTWRAASSSSNSPMVNHAHTPQTTQHPSTAPSSTPVRLPPGFDTLFSQSSQPQTQTPTSTPTPYTAHHANHHNPSTPTASMPHQTTTPNVPPNTDNTMLAAMLETLGKLNKHLDSTATSSLQNTTTPSSSQNPLATSTYDPLTSPSQQTSQETHAPEPGSSTANPPASATGDLETLLTPTTLSKLKDALKKEMLSDLRSEWDKERAVLEEKLDSVQRTQEMIMEFLRQEPAGSSS
ncbi:hypothetical protein BJY04DRAFT_214107 [Aspergillus karnatakaensis]|uniref:uncharacterized protein n=1 Tax=Aspergillus karnatakaensis TaxID=1810916 RepID=UPI003CCE4724